MENIIGHRGAAGLGLENSADAIKQALAHGVSAVEIDVRQSRDQRLVLCHDADLMRMTGDPRLVGELSWEALQGLQLLDGSKLLLLEDALKLIGKTPVIIEVKDDESEETLLAVLDNFPKSDLTVASFKRSFLTRLRELRPDLKLYVLEHTDALDSILFAKRHKLQGIGLNFWLLSPIAYNRAKKAGLDIYVYTVNHRFLAWFLHLLYPKATICTDHPERFNQ
jgi:glycerophosphoryl diester phosphodiesterase